jgi:hypothetical protein
MSSKTTQYKDMVLSTNTDLFKAVQDGETEKAAQMYKDLNDAFYKANPGWKPYPSKVKHDGS